MTPSSQELESPGNPGRFTAVVTTIIASLDFGVNWRANRAARHRTDMLLVESHKSDPDPDNVLDQLSAIIGLRLSESKKDD